MTYTFTSPPQGGRIAAIPSKSAAHRILICAAFADKPTHILCPVRNDDIDATTRALCALGAQIKPTEDGFSVSPTRPPCPIGATLDCGESGSTLRFLLPVVATVAREPVLFVRRGRLPKRPLSPLYEELLRHGAQLPAEQTTEPLSVCGPIESGDFTLAANVSSQFISGLLMAFPLGANRSTLTLTGDIESADYIRITTDIMHRFGVDVDISSDGRVYSLAPCTYRSPGEITVEGDWSNAALWLAAGAIGQASVTVTGLRADSPQGDRRVAEILARFGADVRAEDDCVTVSPAPLRGIQIDATQIPDLVPVLSAVAAAAKGETVISGIRRLRLKESDRAAAIAEMLSSLGADLTVGENTLTIRGGRPLTGDTVPSHRDHRMVMCAALLSMIAHGTVSVTDAASVTKSYPGFAKDFCMLGGGIKQVEDPSCTTCF